MDWPAIAGCAFCFALGFIMANRAMLWTYRRNPKTVIDWLEQKP